MVGLGLYCTVGTLWDPTLTRYHMSIAMRALVAIWPALALSFGRVVIPIHGMNDPRYQGTDVVYKLAGKSDDGLTIASNCHSINATIG